MANGGGADAGERTGIAAVLARQPIPGDLRRHFTTRIGLANTHALGGLRLNGADVLLASAPITMALASVDGVVKTLGALEAGDFPETGLLHLTLDPADQGSQGQIQSYNEAADSWSPLARFTLCPESPAANSDESDESFVLPSGTAFDATRFYDAIRNLGYEYAERHRMLDHMVVGQQSAAAEIDAGARRFVSAADMAALVESGFQLLTAIHMQTAMPGRLMLRGLQHACLHPVPAVPLRLAAQLARLPDGSYRGSLRIATAAGDAAVMTLEGMALEARLFDGAARVDNVVATVAAKSADEQLVYLLKYLRKSLAVILNRADSEHIDQTQTFIRMGMDSLLALQLSVVVQRAFAVAVPVGFLIDQCNLDRLCAFIQAAHASAAGTAAEPALDYVDGEL